MIDLKDAVNLVSNKAVLLLFLAQFWCRSKTSIMVLLYLPSALLFKSKSKEANFRAIFRRRRRFAFAAATFPFISVTLKMDTSSHIPRWSTILKISISQSIPHFFLVLHKVPPTTVQTKWSIGLKPQNSSKLREQN